MTRGGCGVPDRPKCPLIQPPVSCCTGLVYMQLVSPTSFSTPRWKSVVRSETRAAC
jgi:hypothetical protein